MVSATPGKKTPHEGVDLEGRAGSCTSDKGIHAERKSRKSIHILAREASEKRKKGHFMRAAGSRKGKK